jgi:L-fuconolactonase
VLIDAHQHVWRLDTPGHVWPGPDLPAIHKDFEVDDFWTVASPLGVAGTVLVQSQPNAGDTEWLLGVAATDDRVVGVVGWTDLLAADAPARIAALARAPKLRALRPMLQDLPVDWIANPALTPAVEAMIASGLRLDALVRPGHLPFLARFARRWPDLPIIIDHAGKPDIAGGDRASWFEALSLLAGLPNLYCKLSGLLTEKAADQPDDVVVAYIEQMSALFGPDRLVWGSDWPVLTLAGDYAGWFNLARAAVRALDPKALEPVFGANALSFYGGFAAS